MVLIVFDGVSKNFSGVAALRNVGFEVGTGACHALLGENGAGKSTLGKILAGLHRPDGGRILIDGREVQFRSPRDASRAGVGIVHQELVFCPNLSVAENLCLSDLPRRGMFVDRRRLRRQAAERLAAIGLEIDVDRPLSSLSIAQEQLVQIAAAVGLGARILVFDEPTSSLGHGEVRRLFQLIRQLQQLGATILYISHRLEEIFELCQTVTVLRDGRHVATRPIGDLQHDDLVEMMVGRPIDTAPVTQCQAQPGPVRFQCRLSSPGRFTGIHLQLRAGEIVGLAGLVGAGRTEVLEAIFGLDPRVQGDMTVDGKPVRVRSPREAHALGLVLIPDDRQRKGLVPGMNVRENLTLSILDSFRRRLGIADYRAETVLAGRLCRQLTIRTPSAETPVPSLSGGNQQKIVFSRGLAADRRILLIDEPTRGVDVGAKREIHDLVRKLASQGAAVLLVSSDLPELLLLSQRVVVLRQGKIVTELPQRAATADAVLRAMAGIGAAPH